MFVPWCVRCALCSVVVLAAGCASVQEPSTPAQRPLTAAEGRALIAKLLPDAVRDKPGWATDLFAAFASLEIAATPQHFCEAIAVAGQESSFQADPVVPGLPAIAKREIERRREAAGVPKFALDAALALTSTNGKTYAERLDGVKTEQQLSEIYEDFIGRVPFGKRLLAERNPVKTAGPMQVSVAFAEEFAKGRPYPYPLTGTTIRHELFTRRGGLYFGVAHLLDYRAPYDQPLYRFADFNAGRYASRNAAFQSAVTQVSGIPLDLDGDLLRYEHGNPTREAGATELAVRVLAARLGLGSDDIRRDLEHEKEERFEDTRLYRRVFELADRAMGRPAPRAVVPSIRLSSPKITRELTTEWFAHRVQSRYESCMQRIPA
jgi:hypothetical protein